MQKLNPIGSTQQTAYCCYTVLQLSKTCVSKGPDSSAQEDQKMSQAANKLIVMSHRRLLNANGAITHFPAGPVT